MRLLCKEVLNKAISLLLQEEINLVGAGRTDTGVHASHFVAHFDTSINIQNAGDLCYKLNRFLDHNIRIDRIIEVNKETHARYSAISRTYQYYLTRRKSPFFSAFSWTIHGEIDQAKMQIAADYLLTIKDFTSFARLHSDTKTNLCELQEARWEQWSEGLMFEITADRFLRNMVRAIVGTLIEVGLAKINMDELIDICNSKDRSLSGQSAPPNGLFLAGIQYPPDLFESTILPLEFGFSR